MNPEEPFSLVLVIIIYVFGALFVALWLYLTTKITFSIFSKERVILRISFWLIIAWVLAIVLYFIFLVGGGLIVLGIELIRELIK